MAAANGATIATWDLHSGTEPRTIRTKSNISQLAIADDGRSLVVTGYGWIEMWDVVRGTRRWDKTFTPDGGDHAEARFAPNRHKILIQIRPFCVNKMRCTLVDHLEIVDVDDARVIWSEPSNDVWNHGYAITDDLRTIAGIHWTETGDAMGVLGSRRQAGARVPVGNESG